MFAIRKKFGAVPSGVVQGGAVAQVVTKGVLDSWLVSPKPDVHYFRSQLLRTSNFALDVVNQQFVGNTNYGSEFSLTVQKTADLLKEIDLLLVRPGITAVWDENYRGGSHASGSGSSSSSSSRFRGSRKKRAQRASRGGVYVSYNNDNAGGRTNKYGEPIRSRPSRNNRRGRRNNAPVYVYDDGDYDEFEEDFMLDEECADAELRTLWDDIADGYEEEELEDGEDGQPYAHYVNKFGLAAIARTTMTLAGGLAQNLTGKFMHAWFELTALPGKEMDDLIGHYDTKAELIKASQHDERLYVKIPFSNTRFTTRALPLIAMRFHGCDISVALNPLSSLVKVSHPNVKVIKTSDHTPLTSSDINVSLDITYAFLDMADRVRFAKGHIHMLFDQVQYVHQASKGATISAALTINNPVRALIFTVQRTDALKKNDHFDYSTEVENEDPVEFAQLVLNTVPRFAREGEYFRRVVPHKMAPRRLKRNVYIYVMSFGLDIASEFSTGTFNFSRTDSAILNLDLAESLHDKDVILDLYALSINVAEWKKGLFSMLYN